MQNPHGMDTQMGMMQDSMLMMHEQRRQIMGAKNPQERERLMQAHREIIPQHIQAMKNVGWA